MKNWLNVLVELHSYFFCYFDCLI